MIPNVRDSTGQTGGDDDDDDDAPTMEELKQFCMYHIHRSQSPLTILHLRRLLQEKYGHDTDLMSQSGHRQSMIRYLTTYRREKFPHVKVSGLTDEELLAEKQTMANSGRSVIVDTAAGVRVVRQSTRVRNDSILFLFLFLH